MPAPRQLIEGKHLAGWKMLPAKPGTCEECAVAHEPEMPHDASSMFYQYHFYNRKGRWPNWKDAMSHCAPEIRGLWTEALIETGIDVEGGAVRPKEAP
jgi:hypothetical protein